MPHRAHVLRARAHPRGARDDPRRRRGRPARRAREDPADAARRLRRALPRDGRPAGHDPPARSAAPRVPAAHARTRSRSSRASSACPPRSDRGASRRAARGQPDARPPRLPPRDHLSRRSTRSRCARSSRPPRSVARGGRRRAARDHDPARDGAARSCAGCASSSHEAWTKVLGARERSRTRSAR